MTKSKLLLTSLLSTVTVTGSLLLTTVSPTQALPCSFGKKGMSPTASGEPSSLVGNKIDLYKKLGIAGVGIAAVAGGFVAVKKLKARQSQPTEATVTDTPLSESFEIYNFAIPVPPEAVAASTPEAEASERDVTSVS
ncbi:MAG: hypothetical protein RID09_12165 [Coleofasciculus sp. G1-WW12-02]|uniref:hypothetical protein n=1 Tax=Coleofasciculus sp. G1-WW12-02 TaxID=3068483 RepID=UPI0032FE87D8